jgi:hypothetical protein
MSTTTSKRLIVLCLGSAVAGALLAHALPKMGMFAKEGVSALSSASPPYLDRLAAQGYGVKPIPAPQLAQDGWRVWNIDRHGDDVLAFAGRDNDALIVGGELYDREGERISETLRSKHHREHLTLASVSQQSRWVDLPLNEPEETDPATDSPDQSRAPILASNAPDIVWLADPTDPAVQDAYATYMSSDNASAVRFIPYPDAESHSAMNGVIAILEADYRTPAGQPEVITQQRGGDLGFTHTSSGALRDLLNERVIPAPRATDGHPAEQEAFQGVSQNLYLIERLGIEGAHVFHPAENIEQGDSLAMTPLSKWIGANSD